MAKTKLKGRKLKGKELPEKAPSADARRQSEYAVGDYVFTKIKGHPEWPSKIASIELVSRGGKEIKKYGVFFFGTNETATVFAERLYPYMPNRERFGYPKSQNSFNGAMFDLEKDLRNNSKSNKRKRFRVEEEPVPFEPESSEGESSSPAKKAREPEQESTNEEDSSRSGLSADASYGSRRQEVAMAFDKLVVPTSSNEYDHDVRFMDFFYWKVANEPAKCNRQTEIDSLNSIMQLESDLLTLMQSEPPGYAELLALIEPATRHLYTARRVPMLLRPSFMMLLMRLYRTEIQSEDSEELNDTKTELKKKAGELAYRFLTHVWRSKDDEDYPQPAPPCLSKLLDYPILWRQRMADSCMEVLHRPENERYLNAYQDLSLYFGPS